MSAHGPYTEKLTLPSARRYVYLWADGVYFAPRLEHDRQCILVLIGADAQGRKELLAIEDGFRESAQSWRELLLRLRDQNGLVLDPELATGDGALGFWRALHEIWPKTRQQRCWVGLLKNSADRDSTSAADASEAVCWDARNDDSLSCLWPARSGMCSPMTMFLSASIG